MFSRLSSIKGKVRYGGIAVVLVIGIAAFFLLRNGEEAAVATDEPLAVRVAPVAALQSDASRTYIGTVSAVNQAKLQTEVGGRVVSVPVQVGARVPAGAVIAQIENSAERAAVTQAEGAYEAARAGALQADTGVTSAETALTSAREGAVVAMRDSYTAVNSALRNSIDQFFSNPESSIPGLRIDGNAQKLNAERVAYQGLLSAWQADIATLGNADVDRLIAELGDTENYVRRTIVLVEEFVAETSQAGNSESLDGRLVTTYTAGLLSEVERLNASLRAVQSARTTLIGATEALERARVGGTDADVSLANAQVKQALGALQAAQAALAKTIVRSPIAGTVNAVQVKTGDNVGAGAAVAEIVNDSAYELSIFVSELERSTAVIGNPVRINDAIDGTVTNIAPALDPRTQKVEVKIAVESRELLSGTTAVVTFASTSATSSPAASVGLTIPLTAVAFSIEGGAVLVIENDMVAARPVTLGEIRGSTVAITGDITPTTEIIVDARGLVVGQKVTALRN